MASVGANAMPNFEIRRAEQADAPAIHRCLTAAFDPYRSQYTEGAFGDTVPSPAGIEGRLRDMTLFVASALDGAIVGTIACQDVGRGLGHLRGMAVDPGWQGLGIADALIKAAEDELRRVGFRRVNLHTTQPLARAQRFYARHGFRLTGDVEDFFGMEIAEHAKDL
ncbi:MAG TPA: GNAT family N-acetyltransferase [Candidatus Eisenbacteria bacterium]|nr:GNAT family N-acetyltransferase [Candidatus Eisenbacteria bacterium]